MIILALEDDPLVAETLEMILQDAGHQALMAATVQEAVDWLDGGLIPDVLVTDIHLHGGGSGWDAIERVRARFPSTRIIVSTGNPADEMLSLQQENCQYIPKPYRADTIISALNLCE